MKKVMLLLTTVLVALVVIAPAGAASGGRFVGVPECTADDHGNVTCTARVAGLTDGVDLAYVVFEMEWACIADPTITVTATTGDFIVDRIQNGRLFTVHNSGRDPLFYEIIFGIDFGCPGDAWTAVRYTNVTVALYFSGLSYNVGTIYPS
jgi:hypothetical protein